MLKFTRDGKFLLQVGKSAARKGPNNAQGQPTYVGGSNDTMAFGRVAKIFVDPRPTRRISPTATSTSAWRSSTPRPASSNATGALRQQAGR